jgi:DNA polymerase-3 subunit alpha (Gram-positive type)
LGHNAPWTLAKLREASGIDFNKIKYNDEKVYRMLWDKTVIYDQLEQEQIEAFEKHFDRDGLNNGLPEISTVFLGGMIKNLKPTTFEELVRIEGLSHRTNLYVGSQKEALEKRKITPEEVFGCREEVKNFLVKGGIEEIKAFYIVESLRKGKKLKPEELTLVKNCKLNPEVIKNILGIKYLFPEAEQTKLGPR